MNDFLQVDISHERAGGGVEEDLFVYVGVRFILFDLNPTAGAETRQSNHSIGYVFLKSTKGKCNREKRLLIMRNTVIPCYNAAFSTEHISFSIVGNSAISYKSDNVLY